VNNNKAEIERAAADFSNADGRADFVLIKDRSILKMSDC
jgi:hypothetical protein